ncbi:NADH-ubiquinone oxidoreductase 12 kDa subunit [Colletotrichum higginsianum]|nr:NADH-ubiquinone oxidoreductase 12 kDa subunit [Colletotrichum higginsianum]
MPTPESEMFLAQKPKAFKQAQDAIIREQWVGAMMLRLVGEELGKCYKKEGVNHLEKCGHLREKYLVLLKEKKVKGTLFEQQNYISKQ